MATIKSFTDLEQSKKLAEILPLESADNVIVSFGSRDGVKTVVMPKETLDVFRTPFADIRETTVCWSLAALLGVLPDEMTDDGDVYRNMLFHLKGEYIIQYPRLTTLWPSLLSVEADNPVDACVAMIINLNEHKRL